MSVLWNVSQLLAASHQYASPLQVRCDVLGIAGLSSRLSFFRPALLASSALALAIACAPSAYAAPRKAPQTQAATQETAPPPEAEPEFTWSGFYIGSNFGGGFGTGTQLSGFGTDAALGPNAFWGFPGANPGGVLGGLQAGHLWQIDKAVVGFEADVQAAGLSGSTRGVGVSLGAVPFVAAHQTIDWFGTLRGRIGYAPVATLLLYGTGGLAYGGGGYEFTTFTGDNLSGTGFHDSTRLGWTAGAGVEWAFLPDWSAKLEYLYVDLGRTPTHALNLVDADGETVVNAATLSGATSRFHTVRVGLNYHFNVAGPDFGGSSEPFYHPASDKFHEIETHYIFGFTEGSDIDAEGEKELEFITLVNQGRRQLTIAPDDPDPIATITRGGAQGFYRSIGQKIEFEHTLTQNFQYSLGITGYNFRIRGVEGIDDLTNTSLKGLSGEFRYVLIGRGPGSPFGVTLQVEPEWGRVSETSGQREAAFEVETKFIVDTELIQNRLYAAVNFVYVPEISRGLGETLWGRESTLGLTGGVTYRLTPQIAFGGGLQYYRAHSDGFWFNKLEGQALYAGPTLFMRLDKKIFVSAAFSTQLRGHAEGESHALDLTNFSRYMARLQLGVEF